MGYGIEMAYEFCTAIAIPLLGGAALTFLVERLLDPAPDLIGRPASAVSAHLGVWTAVFAILIVILIFRPTGLLGARMREKV